MAAGSEATGNPILVERERGEDGRDPARHGRPRPGRRVQLADHPRRDARVGRGARGRAGRARSTPSAAAASRRCSFRNLELAGQYAGFTDRPGYANAREIADDLITAYVDEQVDRVEIVYNGYVSPLVQEVRREVLLPLQQATIYSEAADAEDEEDQHEQRAGAPLVEYEPDPDAILERLIPDYVEISVYRALLESTASEHGARMTAMRSASDNAGEVIEDLTLEMNRARQAEITQEIMEVVAGAESLLTRRQPSTRTTT